MSHLYSKKFTWGGIQAYYIITHSISTPTINKDHFVNKEGIIISQIYNAQVLQCQIVQCVYIFICSVRGKQPDHLIQNTSH